VEVESTIKMQFVRLFLILLFAITTLSGGLGLLSADTARAAAAEGRGQSKVNVLLRVETDDERRNVDDLLANTDVALADQDTGVVDGLGKAELVDASLEAALQEILDLEGQDVIELHAGLVEDTDTDKTANEGIAFEETLGVLLLESKKLTAVEC
jgi:nucleoside-triphosphatase THEP1